jgi:ribosomal protein L16/L10AE
MNAKVASIVTRLNAGEKVENREGGNSMVPLIYSRQPVTIEAVDASKLERGDIVYVKVHGNVYTHKVVGVRPGEVQIGNNKGGVNGWTKLDNVYGIVTEIEGRPVGGSREKVRRPS